MEKEGCVTGLATLGRKKLCIMGMNWRYLHKEKVDKQNPIKKHCQHLALAELHSRFYFPNVKSII